MPGRVARRRAAVPGGAPEVGITLNLTPVRTAVLPAAQANGSAGILERARKVAAAAVNGLFLEPLLSGLYPAHAPAAVLPPAGLIADGDMEAIAAPLDFLGVNYYSPIFLGAGDPDDLRRNQERARSAVPGVLFPAVAAPAGANVLALQAQLQATVRE